MQHFNKEASKKTLVYTWYVYPVSLIFACLLLLWSFGSFHQPTKHQSITMFFGTEIRSVSFGSQIKNKFPKEKKLKAVSAYSVYPTHTMYYNKLNLYLSNADLLILPKSTLDEFEGHHDLMFVEFNQTIKDTYLNDNNSYYVGSQKEYGVLLKEKEGHNWLEEYMDFVPNEDYYLTLSVTSKNLDDIVDENNKGYDNALLIMNYLLGGLQ